ncbi:hypothetical protein QFC19_008969 [Naganishia cerealis]|uniref:Uncharacterized protein n=1 Tax=Naganishia cerealis TaxID=610337 RepID=A0ACC2UXT4_9TREE|nr:hypothetical protein QFC19_008969 [Naganishia cerealis]
MGAPVECVVAYYDEDVDILRNTIQTVKRKIQAYHTTKTIVYAKGPTHAGNREAMHRLRRAVGADEVVALKNVGREGETYLGDLCPGDGFSITWAGQFLASRQRILANKRSTYVNLLEFFHVPKLAEDDPAYATTRKEWIWKEGWW